MPRLRSYRAVEMYPQILVTARPPKPKRRCTRCRCVLARDQKLDICSPCQRRKTGTPPWIGDFLHDS
jgi:hypothetical protein